jgi:hypothetical protein
LRHFTGETTRSVALKLLTKINAPAGALIKKHNKGATMPAQKLAKSPDRAAATRTDLIHVLGELDDARALEILALQPTVADLEEAALWLHGNGDLLGKSGHPLTGVAGEIFAILAADEEQEPPSAR